MWTGSPCCSRGVGSAGGNLADRLAQAGKSVAVVGEAPDHECDAIVADVDLPAVPTAETEGETLGCVELVHNRGRGILIGVTVIGPHADAWLGEATLALRSVSLRTPAQSCAPSRPATRPTPARSAPIG